MTNRTDKDMALFFIFLAVLLVPLEPYRYEIYLGVNISPSRAFTIAAICLTTAQLISGRRIVPKNCFPLLFCAGLIIFIVSVQTLTNVTHLIYSFSSLPNFILCLLSFMCTYIICVGDKRALLVVFKAIYISAFIYLFFCFYSIYYWLFFGGPPTDIPFRDILPFIMPIDKFLEVRQVLGYNLFRLSLPFSTPPHLSIVSCVLSLLLLTYSYSLQKLNKSICLVAAIILGIVVFMTGSRSGMIPYITGLTTMFVAGKIKKLIKVNVGIILILTCIIISLFFNDIIAEFILASLERLWGHSFSSHIATRSDGLALFLTGDSLNMLFGRGEGLLSASAHYHMSYLDILIATGIIGLIIFAAIFIIITLNLLKQLRCQLAAPYDTWVLGSFAAILAIILGHALYEFFFINALWFVVGWIAALSKSDLYSIEVP